MDIRQLKFFLAIVDNGGFKRAADELMVAQPSLSQAIANFERELGMPLFHRVNRGIVLSDAGRALLSPARLVMRDIDEAVQAVRELQNLRKGRLNLITMPSPALEPLTTLMTSFITHHPEVPINAEAGFTAEEVLGGVRSGRCEIGILGSAEPTRAPDLDVIALESQALVLISASDADGPTTETVHRDDLNGCRLIVSQRGSLMRAFVDDILNDGIEVSIVAEIAHRTSILSLVLTGIGRAVMPAAWVSSARREGARVQRIIPETYLHIAAVSRRNHLSTPAVAFMRLAREYGAAVSDGSGPEKARRTRSTSNS